jgi:hypothetical protein
MMEMRIIPLTEKQLETLAKLQKQDVGYVTVPKQQLRELREKLRWLDGLTNGEELELIDGWLQQ